MDEALKRALAAAARAFADELERDLAPRPGDAQTAVAPGTIGSMLEVLRCVGRINDELDRGANDDEMRDIARRVGMDPRGMAGYYAANLLEKRDDGRWLREEGRERLVRLQALRNVRILEPPTGGARPDTTPE